MSDDSFYPVIHSPVALNLEEQEVLFAINQATAEEPNLEKALDRVSYLVRRVLIFDNIVVYLRQDETIEPVYARVIGRGKAFPSELAWGEAIASEVVNSGISRLTQERLENWEENRLHLRYILGVPLRSPDGVKGAVVFGRFGGPDFTSSQVQLAEFIAVQVNQLLIRQQLVQRVATLEAERQLRTLQENFIATVSHELKTPLGFIKGYTTTLLREDAQWDDATQREFLMIINEEAERLRGLIDNLLDSSRLQSGALKINIEFVHLDELLRDIISRTLGLHSGLDIRLAVDEPVDIYADPTRITQIIENLIQNAIKYAAGSPIILVMKKTLLKPQQEDGVEIIVQDFGPGIPEEHAAHIFERFYRVPNSTQRTQGTGLGLFIARELVQAHGGQITLESSMGGGAAFHIFLPIDGRIKE
jgi:signal transduction histidine kinase